MEVLMAAEEVSDTNEKRANLMFVLFLCCIRLQSASGRPKVAPTNNEWAVEDASPYILCNL